MRDKQIYGKEVVLAGGGHTNALFLRQWAMNPVDGVQITLVSNVTYTPYSGMLPGFIAGTYTFEECHIDLRALCEAVGARFIHDEVTGIDPQRKRLLLKGRPPLEFDYLSVNIGSQPQASSLNGAKEFGIAVKPVDLFLERWRKKEKSLLGKETPRLAIIGGGAAGVELALSFHKRFAGKAKIVLFEEAETILPNFNKNARKLAQTFLRERGIEIVCGEAVQSLLESKVTTASQNYEADAIFLVTHAAAPAWLKESNLALDDKGFIQVNTYLQTSHPEIFATGDIASIKNHPRAKSGVYAVRQAPVLFANIQNAIHKYPLKNYRPQQHALALIGTGSGEAIAVKGPFGWSSKTIWRLKDRIDRRFMRMFQELPQMDEPKKTISTAPTDELKQLQLDSQIRCKGCAAKVPRLVLGGAIKELQTTYPEAFDFGLLQAGWDDAAVLPIPSGSKLVCTTDFLSAFTQDPFLLGKISVYHALSDIYAMGGKPNHALALAQLPFAETKMQKRQLFQLMAGVVEALVEEGAKLVGGHTAEGDLGVGLTVLGQLEGEPFLKRSLEADDILILTKPLGTGVVFAAAMRGAAMGSWVEQALTSMSSSNRQAAEIFRGVGVKACTDVTGFGLAGHLLEMIDGSQKNVSLFLDAIPLLAGVAESYKSGIFSSLHEANRSAFGGRMEKKEGGILLEKNFRFQALFDPQTSGGLLAAVPQGKAQETLQSLRAQNISAKAVGIVGREFSDPYSIKIYEGLGQLSELEKK